MNFILRLLKFWVLLVFGASTVYVGINNQETVVVSLPPLMTRTMSAWEAFAGFTLFGAFVVLIWFGIEHISMAWRIRKLRQRVAELEPKPVQAQAPPVAATAAVVSASASDANTNVPAAHGEAAKT